MVRVRAGILVVLVLPTAVVSGCFGTSNDTVTVRVHVETSYDPELAPSPEARERAEELGFRRGDPASLGRGYLLVEATNHPNGSDDTVVDPYHNVSRNETLDLGYYRLPLDADGGASFAVEAPEPPHVAISPDGEPSPDGDESDCAGTYFGGTGQLSEGGPPERQDGYVGPLREDLNVTVPFALRC